MVTCVYVAGIDNSPPDHWQALWFGEDPTGVWVGHDSWDEPARDAWVADLDKALAGIDGPVYLVAHSLGCLLVTEWARDHAADAVAGAFLAAFPDVHGDRFPTAATGFCAPRDLVLPFPSVVVASDDDPYGTAANSVAVAEGIGATVTNVGLRGHINSASNLGEWSEGRAILDAHMAEHVGG